MEACRIVVLETSPGIFDVGAPMQHKPLCYDILKDAQNVIAKTSDEHFHSLQNCLTIVMDMTGRVDVAAPLPQRDKCEIMLKAAKSSIQRYNDESAPVMRAFSEQLMG
jgi:hypothetical protein